MKPAPNQRLAQFAPLQAQALLEHLVSQIERVRTNDDADSVHDLRVAVRRFSQCLDVFDPFFPEGAARKVRSRVNRLRKSAGLARDCDIALEYLEKNEVPLREELAEELRETRKRAHAELLSVLHKAHRKHSCQKWARRLGLGDAGQ